MTNRLSITRFGRTLQMLCILLLTVPPLALAQPDERQPHDLILQAAKSLLETEATSSFPEARVTVKTGQLDTRLILPACPVPLEAFRTVSSRPAAGNITVGVRCPAGTDWTVYVPSVVSVYVPVVVMARSQNRGSLLGTGDIGMEERDLGTLTAGYLLEQERAIGMELKRNMTAGNVLTSTALTQPRLVRRGQSVTLIAEGTSFTVRVAGEALQDGVIGDRIRVRNSGSKRVIEGYVEGPGLVRVTM